MPEHSPVAVVARAATSGPFSIAGVKLFGDDGFNFRDVLDLINPIQHIPLVGNLYRKLTGDIAAPAIRIAGGALFGGPLGAAFAAANVAFQRIVQPDLGAPPAPRTDTAIAAAAPAPRESRGGWMVAQQRAFPLPVTAANENARALAQAPRGPLEVGKAYGLDEVEAERRHLFGSFHLQA